MDIDPLGDVKPPRYAVESDDEDEWDPLSYRKGLRGGDQTDLPPVTIIRWEAEATTGRPLAIASGHVGRFWACGVDLGREIGSVSMNGVQVGSLFRARWTEATVLISEATTRLPAWAMHPYTEAIILELQPTSVSILDTYALPAYMSTEVIPAHRAPVRYLSTKTKRDVMAPLFSAPNIVTSLSASFLSTSSISSLSQPSSQGLRSFDCTVILVPSLHISPPPPRNLTPNGPLTSNPDSTQWSADLMIAAQENFFLAIGEKGQKRWDYVSRKDEMFNATKKKGDVGDGGMYI